VHIRVQRSEKPRHQKNSGEKMHCISKGKGMNKIRNCVAALKESAKIIINELSVVLCGGWHIALVDAALGQQASKSRFRRACGAAFLFSYVI
jgi:hypothetical protein